MAKFPAVVIPNTEMRVLYSKIAKRDYQIYVGFPYNYYISPKTFPVLYILDAQIGFSIVEFLRMLQHARETPEFLVVGIGYSTDHFIDTFDLRQCDYTPTIVEEEKQESSVESLEAEDAKTGGAATFLRFLREELFPFIEGTYRVAVDDRGIVGVSLGGLFALYTLFHQLDTFGRYVVISPSLWWDNDITFLYENQYAVKHTCLNAKVFLSAGALETEDIKENTVKLSERLKQRGYQGLHLKTHIFADETHVSGVASAICRGVKEIYNPES